MDHPYFAGMDAQEGTPAHTLYIWIECLHERMDLLVEQFTGDDWEHDYSIASLRLLEEDLVSLYAVDDGTHAQAFYMECLAGYLGEALLDEGGGRWVWLEDAGAVGLPAVQPDPALGLEPIVPILLVGQAVYEKTENIFATVALRLRKAVTDHKAAHPGWKPERVPTPWVRYHELDACGALWKYWPNERFHDYLTWWAEKAGGGRERWDFEPASLDVLEQMLRERLGTVEEYNKVAGRPFWVVAAWYAGEYVVRRKGASWQFRASNPGAPSGTWHAEDSYWTDSIHVAQRMRYAGHAEHPTDMLRAVLEGESLRDVVDRFPDPIEEPVPGKPAEGTGEPWPEILWPLVAPEHLPPPLTAEQRDELAEELRQLEEDPDLKDPDWHDNPRLNTWLAERREAFPDWADRAGGGVEAWDFSPASLDRLEDLVRARFATYEEIEAARDDPFVVGAAWYLGEVQVRHRDARWSFGPEPDEQGHDDEPAVVEPDRDEDDFDDYEEYEADVLDDPEGLGYVCLPASHLSGLIRRADPDERLRDVLDSYRRRPAEAGVWVRPSVPQGSEHESRSALSVPGVRLRPMTGAKAGAKAGAMGDSMSETAVTRVAHGARDDQEVRPKMGSEATLTLLFPPFPETLDAHGGPGRTAHDPVRARQFVEELGTVEEVIEELPTLTIGNLPLPDVRADLARVAVGCWGNVVHIVEPALGSDLLTEAMAQEIRRQRAQHPQARIVGSVVMDYGNSYLEDVVVLPDGENVVAGGWDCDDDWDIIGDPEALLRAIGVDRDVASDEGFDFDEEPSERDWPVLGRLALGGRLHPAANTHLEMSVFHVRRTEGAQFNLEEVWFGR